MRIDFYISKVNFLSYSIVRRVVGYSKNIF